MKCPECDGYGKVGKYNYYGTCPQCGGTGEMETEMTNEEWFCSLPTEKKAKVLACEFVVACDDYAYSNNKETWNEKYWVEWLKQPHND